MITLLPPVSPDALRPGLGDRRRYVGEGADAAAYAELAAAFPPPTGTPGTYGYDRRRAKDFVADKTLPAVWRDFWRDHLTGDTVRRFLWLFGDQTAAYPRLATLDPDRTEIRKHVPAGMRPDFVVEGQFVHHSSPAAGSPVVPPHLDEAKRVFFLLWYFRHPDDESAGGDLAFYSAEPFAFNGRRFPSAVREREAVPYEANRLVVCMNHPRQVHGATARTPSPYPRRHVEISVELPSGPLFGPEDYGRPLCG